MESDIIKAADIVAPKRKPPKRRVDAEMGNSAAQAANQTTQQQRPGKKETDAAMLQSISESANQVQPKRIPDKKETDEAMLQSVSESANQVQPEQGSDKKETDAAMLRETSEAANQVRRDYNIATLGPWNGGLVEDRPPEMLQPNECSELSNFILDESGYAFTRDGVEEYVTGAIGGIVHIKRAKIGSTWYTLAVDEHDYLYKVNGSGFDTIGYLEGEGRVIGSNDKIIIFDGGNIKYWDGTYSKGSDLVTDGDMGTAGSWTAGGNATVDDGGSGVAASASGGNGTLLQAITDLVIGRLYEVSFDVTATNDDGALWVSLCDAANVALHPKSTSYPTNGIHATVNGTGSYTYYLRESGDGNLTFQSNSANSCSIDNLEVKEVTSLSMLYDRGTGDETAYQYHFIDKPKNDVQVVLLGDSSGDSLYRVAAKVTTQDWDDGYTLPPTDWEIYLSRVSALSNQVKVKIWDATTDDVIAEAEAVSSGDGMNNISPVDYTYLSGTFTEVYENLKPNTDYYFGIQCANLHATVHYIVPFWVDAFNTGTLYVYDTAWNNTGLNNMNPVMSFKPGMPPKCVEGKIYKSRILAIEGEDGDNPERLHFSNAKTALLEGEFDWSSYDSTTGEVFAGYLDSNHAINGLASFRGAMWIFGTADERVISRLTGATPQYFALDPVISNAYGHYKSIVTAPSDCYFLNENGVFSLVAVLEFGDVDQTKHCPGISKQIRSGYSESVIMGYEPHNGILIFKTGTDPYVVYTRCRAQNPSGRSYNPAGKWDLGLGSGVTETCYSAEMDRLYIGTDAGEIQVYTVGIGLGDEANFTFDYAYMTTAMHMAVCSDQVCDGIEIVSASTDATYLNAWMYINSARSSVGSSYAFQVLSYADYYDTWSSKSGTITVGTVVTHSDGKLYTCQSEHTKAAGKEPGASVGWETYWSYTAESWQTRAYVNQRYRNIRFRFQYIDQYDGNTKDPVYIKNLYLKYYDTGVF